MCVLERERNLSCYYCRVFGPVSSVLGPAGGYLPFTFFQWSHLKGKAYQHYISARSYTTARLCGCFRNMNQQLLPLCAVLNGNDYHPPNERLLALLDAQLPASAAGKSGKSSVSRVERLLSWLSSFTSVSEALEEIGVLMGSKGRGAEPLISHLLAGMEDYHIRPRCNLALWFSGGDGAVPWEPIAGLPEALWLVAAQALLPSMVVDAAVTRKTMLSLQVENCRLPSGNVCAQAIRQAIYGILLRDHAAQGAPEDTAGRRRRGGRGPGGTGSSAPLLVDEYDRLDLKLKITQVEAVAPRTPLPLDKLHQASPAKQASCSSSSLYCFTRSFLSSSSPSTEACFIRSHQRSPLLDLVHPDLRGRETGRPPGGSGGEGVLAGSSSCPPEAGCGSHCLLAEERQACTLSAPAPSPAAVHGLWRAVLEHSAGLAHAFSLSLSLCVRTIQSFVTVMLAVCSPTGLLGCRAPPAGLSGSYTRQRRGTTGI